MLRKYIIRDIPGVFLLLIASLVGGLGLNEMRSSPLPLVYSSPQSNLDQTAEDVDLEEMQKLWATHEALIVDARSEQAYRAGHIPSAVNLPRDDFDKKYQALLTILQSHRTQPLIVYCSGLRCPDSQIVAAELQRRGYLHVRLLSGGWNSWQSANLPEEKE